MPVRPKHSHGMLDAANATIVQCKRYSEFAGNLILQLDKCLSARLQEALATRVGGKRRCSTTALPRSLSSRLDNGGAIINPANNVNADIDVVNFIVNEMARRIAWFLEDKLQTAQTTRILVLLQQPIRLLPALTLAISRRQAR